MIEIEEKGGAKIGIARASRPFARLTVNKNVLQLNAYIIGNLYFRPSDVISIEPSPFLSGPGIKIVHRVKKYRSKVIFLTSGGADLLRRIESTGFLRNTDALPADVEAEIARYQAGGGAPIKLSAVIACIAISNLLGLYDLFRPVHSKNNLPVGIGAQTAIGLVFLSALGVLISKPFRRLILKEGRTVKDVKSFVIFLMLLSGFMFLWLLALKTFDGLF